MSVMFTCKFDTGLDLKDISLMSDSLSQFKDAAA